MTRLTLSDEDRKEVVKYRIEKSKLSFQAALVNIANDFPSTAANRLYYAAYYAVSALLIANGISVKSHDGVRKMLGLHFIKTHLLDVQYGQTFSLLLSLRMVGDYQDRKNLDMEFEVKPLVEPTRQLIDVVANMAIEATSGC